MMPPVRSIVLLLGLACLAQLAACAALPRDDPALYARLTDQDVDQAAVTLQEALEAAPNGATQSWTNRQSGHSGSITPIETYQAADGLFCRRYREELRIGAATGLFIQTACREDEGRWAWL